MDSRLHFYENVDLAPLTTLQVGGPARYFAVARGESDVRTAIEFADERGLPMFVLGGGSNLLVADGGYDGLVLRNEIKGVAETSFAGTCSAVAEVSLAVGAGEDWDGFVARCVDAGLAGIECLSGIPGTVGATPIQNVGAYGQEVSESIASLACIDRLSGERVELSNRECAFGYRTSAFNSVYHNRYIVTSVQYTLKRGAAPRVAYKDLANVFADQNPTLSDVRSAVLRIRAAKSMVVDPTDANSRSAGSFFKNPIVSAEKLKNLRSYREDIPSFAYGSSYKMPAAWLIEAAGFSKGYCLGRAAISSNHSLALINRGGATAAEIIVLRDEITAQVADKFGIKLEQEPIMLGFGE